MRRGGLHRRTRQLVTVDAQQPLGVQAHRGRIDVLPELGADVVRHDQPLARRRRHALGERRPRQLFERPAERRRHHEQAGAHRVVELEPFADLGDAISRQLHLRRVVDVEHARQIAIDRQHGRPRSGRQRAELAQQGRGGDLIRHDQQRPLRDEGARRQNRQPVRPVPFGVLEKHDASLERGREARRPGHVPTNRGTVVADGQADLLDAESVEQPERPFEQAGTTDRGEAVRDAVRADRKALTGSQNEGACDHAAR